MYTQEGGSVRECQTKHIILYLLADNRRDRYFSLGMEFHNFGILICRSTFKTWKSDQRTVSRIATEAVVKENCSKNSHNAI